MDIYLDLCISYSIIDYINSRVRAVKFQNLISCQHYFMLTTDDLCNLQIL